MKLFGWIGLLTVTLLAYSCKNTTSKVSQEVVCENNMPETITEEDILSTLDRDLADTCLNAECFPNTGIRYEYGIPVDSFRVVNATIQQGQFLSRLLLNLGAPLNVVRQLETIPADTFDISNIRADVPYSAYYQSDSVLRYFVYKESSLYAYRFDIKDKLEVHKQAINMRKEAKVGRATLTSTLWKACKDAGINPMLAVELENVYQSSFDFSSLDQGDNFVAYYEELLTDSASLGIGKIYAASLVHNGITYNAYYFDTTECKGYFDSKARALRKQFLKAPLNYSKIAAAYSYGNDTSAGTAMPHPGVDFVAPEGTPVVAFGDGTITDMGNKGASGNTIRIRHSGDYTSACMHLGRFATGMTVGKFVRQGQIIGYVGNTDESEEPHLDFRVWKDGSPVNPMTIQSPAAEPVPQKYRAAFAQLVSRMDSIMH